MLSVHQIHKAYGINSVLNDISFNISRGERIGLLGPNGCGKTTLLRILAGHEEPDSGYVMPTHSKVRIGYLPQSFDLDPSSTITEACAQSIWSNPPDNQTKDFGSALADIASRLTNDPSNERLQEQYDSLLHAIASESDKSRFDILADVGLALLDPEQPVGLLSGGQKTRLLLACMLLQKPNLLLLDEPTNHLDIEMLGWLELWLDQFAGAALIVSHDRVFLDRCVSRILYLDGDSHTVREYVGNYSSYSIQRQAEIDHQWSAYRDQQAEIKRMREDILRTKQQAAHTERQASSIRIGGGDYKIKGYKSYQQGIAKKVAKKAKSRQKKLDRYLDSDDLVERPRTSWKMKLDLPQVKQKSRDILITRSLTIGYPDCPPLMSGINSFIRYGERVVLTGPNGCGKTTLLRTISGQLLPQSGQVRLSPTTNLGFMSQEQEGIDKELSPLEIIQSLGTFNQTEARAFLHHYLFSGDEPLLPSKYLSSGERERLELALLVAKGCTFLLLDEPINHLDIPSRERFEQALCNFDGTVLAVIHDRYFIDHFATQVWTFDHDRICCKYS